METFRRNALRPFAKTGNKTMTALRLLANRSDTSPVPFQQQPQSRLLQLPGELLNEIYGYVMLCNIKYCNVCRRRQTKDHRVELSCLRRPRLAAVCRQLQQQYLSYFFGNQRFVFTIRVDTEGEVHYGFQKHTEQWIHALLPRDTKAHNICFRLSFPRAPSICRWTSKPADRLNVLHADILRIRGTRQSWLKLRPLELFPSSSGSTWTGVWAEKLQDLIEDGILIRDAGKAAKLLSREAHLHLAGWLVKVHKRLAHPRQGTLRQFRDDVVGRFWVYQIFSGDRPERDSLWALKLH